ncbi:UNVERIFIED_CONTAM: hypothetical protein PYX00_004647 [Menopon gallinae]|uniref:Nucleolar protein 4 n=1 Tax=Menopon gallinae TaxID=328185 RepID=A0AAW2I634_9NEOP
MGEESDIGSEYKKVAIVENFFDIIFGVHVEIDGRNGKHAGQKRTYRTITETYAFLPREAVTKFLLNCSECQKRPNSPAVRKIPSLKQAKPSRSSWKLIESLFPNSLPENKMSKPIETDVSETTGSSNCEVSFVSEQNSPENLCNRDGGSKTANREPPAKIPRIENYVHTSTPVQAENVRPAAAEEVAAKMDSSTESEKSRDPVATGRFLDGSTGSDTSDSSFENIKSKRKFFRKPFEIGKFRKGIFERNRITETCNNENIFPICYPLPKYESRKRAPVEEYRGRILRVSPASLPDQRAYPGG